MTTLAESRAKIDTLANILAENNEGSIRHIGTELKQISKDLGRLQPAIEAKTLSQIMSEKQIKMIQDAKEETTDETPLTEEQSLIPENPAKWTDEETSTIRTAKDEEEAIALYKRRFGNTRKQSGVVAKYAKLKKAGQLVKKGAKVIFRKEGNTYNQQIAVVKSITSVRTLAEITFSDDVTLTVAISNLEVIA